jgi:precorrin-4 methylase
MGRRFVENASGRSLTGCLVLVLLAVFAVHAPASAAKKTSAKGGYYLVGIGPGDADLLTPRALKVIREADVIFCSPQTQETLAALVDFKDKKVIDGYGVVFHFYGRDCSKLTKEEKSRMKEGMSCEEYHKKQAEFAKIVRKAVKAGKKVVMTCGGDPTIYGPGLWTLQELKDLSPVVVPGLSSFNAASAALQVSLGEVVLTAPFKKDGAKDDIESLAKHGSATMVIFMPRDMKDLLARLSSVYPADTPIAVVAYAGIAGKEKVVSGSLATIAGKLGDTDIRMSLVYVGKAVGNAQYKREGEKTAASEGKFYLVGAGPGDVDMATLRALDVIKKADLIFCNASIKEKFAQHLEGKQVVEGYHRLFPFYKKDCAQITEEEKSRERMSCEEYHRKQAEFASMVRQAVAEGKTVAMLDNGDPLIYGPCSWSLTELRDLDTEVVPGLSSFNAANAALGVGVTEGKSSHSVILASGWSVEEMAPHQATMILYTMRTEFKKFIDSLSKHYPPDTPVAIVMQAGYAEKENVIRGTLGGILAQVGESKLPFEYLLYVGDFLTNSGKQW